MALDASTRRAPLSTRLRSVLTSRFAFRAVLGLLFIATIATRIHSMDRSLWLDEAWVANSALEPSLTETLYYRSWLQTSPPLFLLLLRLVTRALGVSNQILRVVPVAFGILSFPLMAFVACRMLHPWFSVVALALFAFNPSLVHYSHELKQYSSDVFASLVLVSVGLAYLARPSRATLSAWVASFLVLAFLSYQALLFIPGLALAAAGHAARRPPAGAAGTRAGAGWLDATAVALGGLVTAIVNYVFFIKPNKQPVLDYWFARSSRSPHVWPFLVFYLKHALFIAALLLPLEMHQLRWRLLAPLSIVLLGAAALCTPGVRGQRGDPRVGAFLLMPIVCVYVLDMLDIYPGVGTAKLMLFLVPIIIVLFVYGLQTIGYGLCTVLAKPPEPVLEALGVSCLILVIALLGSHAVIQDPSPLFRHEALEDSESAVRYLSRHVRADDVIYVHAAMREQFKLNVRLTPVSSSRLVWGNVGWPCCPRDVILDHGQASDRIMPVEMSRLPIPESGGAVWLLFPDDEGFWRWMGRREPEVFAGWLMGKGCLQTDTASFRRVRVSKFECGQNRN